MKYWPLNHLSALLTCRFNWSQAWRSVYSHRIMTSHAITSSLFSVDLCGMSIHCQVREYLYTLRDETEWIFRRNAPHAVSTPAFTISNQVRRTTRVLHSTSDPLPYINEVTNPLPSTGAQRRGTGRWQWHVIEQTSGSTRSWFRKNYAGFRTNTLTLDFVSFILDCVVHGVRVCRPLKRSSPPKLQFQAFTRPQDLYGSNSYVCWTISLTSVVSYI